MGPHSTDAPPARATKRKPPQRTTEEMKLRLQPPDAAAIRIAADLLEMSISDYVTRLVAVAGDPMKLTRNQDAHTDGARLAAALSHLLEEVRSSRAEFGRAGGLVKSFFVRGEESRDTAELYAHDLAAALRAFIDAGRSVEEALEKLQKRLAPIFGDIEIAARQLTKR